MSNDARQPRSLDEWADQVRAGLDQTRRAAFDEWLQAARARTEDWSQVAELWQQFATDQQRMVIGTHVQWKEIEKQLFRLVTMTPLAQIDKAGKVSTPGVTDPYAIVDVESPVLNFRALMPIVHRINFLQLRYLDEILGYTPEALTDSGWELLTTYAPAGFALRLAMPPLHFRVAPRGTLERFYASDDNWRPPGKAETLFGKLSYLNLPMHEEVDVFLGRKVAPLRSVWIVEIAPGGVRASPLDELG